MDADERPPYTDGESGLPYELTDDGEFTANGFKARTAEALVKEVQKAADEADEKEAAVAKRARLATIVDSDSAYVILGRGTVSKKDLPHDLVGRPTRVKVRSKSAAGRGLGWNVTLIDSGQKVAGVEVYDLSEDQLRILGELDLDITRLRFAVTAQTDKLRSPISDPETVVTRNGPASWKVRTFYYVHNDGELSPHKPYRGYGSSLSSEEPPTEVAGIHDVTFDPVDQTFVADGAFAPSMWEMKRMLAAADNADNGQPWIGDVDELADPGPYASNWERFSREGHIVLEGFDHGRYLLASRGLRLAEGERRGLLASALVGATDGEEG